MKHGRYRYEKTGCRCDVCRGAKAAANKLYQDTAREKRPLRKFSASNLPPRIQLNPTDFSRDYAERHECSPDAYFALLRRAHERGGFGQLGAERVAIAAGLHPSSIWPEWFGPIEEVAS
jgi:hypothetical protein